MVLPVTPLSKWLGENAPAALRLALSPDAESTLHALTRPAGPIVLLAGREGGLSPRERREAQAAGYTPRRLGPRVLRTETAALAALAAMQTLWGDF